MAHPSPAVMQQLRELEAGNPPPGDANVFGAKVPYDDAQLVLIPVPWEVTTSYGKGTLLGPDAIKTASHQLDLTDLRLGKTFFAGITMMDADPRIKTWNDKAQPSALRVIEALVEEKDPVAEDLGLVNHASVMVNEIVYEASRQALQDQKYVAIVGGDHSAPLGLMKALAEKYGDYGVLHVDAHHDLRQAYEGFQYSHASIMFNALEEIPRIKRLTQVAIRDFSSFEYDYARNSNRVEVFYDQDLFRRKAVGENFASITRAIIDTLPQKVYISFDIDGLQPAFCGATGTPVPGGLEYNEAVYLIEELALSGRQVIGFDLCEVAPSKDGSEWDANVGARILYKLCGAVTRSSHLVPNLSEN